MCVLFESSTRERRGSGWRALFSILSPLSPLTSLSSSQAKANSCAKDPTVQYGCSATMINLNETSAQLKEVLKYLHHNAWTIVFVIFGGFFCWNNCKISVVLGPYHLVILRSFSPFANQSHNPIYRRI